MDSLTEQAYTLKAEEYYSRFRSVRHDWESLFSSDLHSVRKILDIGCGSGENIFRFQELGWNAYGTECSSGLRERILRDHPELAPFIGTESLPFGDNLVFGGSFTHIICRAVLQHIPPENIFQSLFGIRSQLALGGFLSLSFPHRRSDLDGEFRDVDGRLHHLHEPERIQLILERMGFVTIHRRLVSDGLGRVGVEWVELLVQKKLEDISSLDKVESILNRDSKNTTYKLALFRAFCDIGVQNQNSVGFEAGRVLVPLHLVAEKWIGYYLPLLANGFIPQGAGETEEKPRLAFRSVMEDVVSRIQPHKPVGTRDPVEIYEMFLSKLALTRTSRIIDTDLGRSIKKLLNLLEKTIVKGPVEYSGSSFRKSGEEKVMRYRHPGGGLEVASISIPMEMWKEFLLFGHWIRDAVVLKWAEETVRFDKAGRFRVSDVLEILLSDISPERTQGLSRKIFEPVPGKICIWSGKSVDSSYAIDHLIPFSLSRNNQLWNLLPSDPGVNSSKSDLLPSNETLLGSSENIFRYWGILSDSDYSNRFYYELKNFTGQNLERDPGWKTVLWEAFRESVETIALHRGVDRWGI